MADINHREALQLVEDDWQADKDNREDALEDLRFASGDQWEEAERQQREAAGRPCLTVNRINSFANQVAGDIRQAQPGIEVFPVDSADDVPIAKIYEGLIRQIEYQSGAQGAYAHGAESAIRCGIGHWRLETDFTTDSVFEQEIKIKRILDPLAVIWDSGAVELDRSDAMHCWVMDWVHENEFEKRFPDAGRKPNDVPVDGERGSSGLYWRRDKFCRIAEYWYMAPDKRNLVLTADGRTLDVTEWDDFSLSRLAGSGAVVQSRNVDGFKVKRRVLDGTDWLEDERDWAGRFIPIVPVMGAEIAFDGKIVRHGLVRWAKDPQKLYNYWRSAAAEAIGRSPKAPWLVTPDMVKGFEGYWSNANRSDQPFLLYNPDQTAPSLKPERQQPPQIPAAMWQEAQVAADDMKATTGIYDASLGAQGNETSGRAILARQREGDVGSFIYMDNFSRAMTRTGQMLVDLIPRIYDTERQVRILDVTGEEQFVPINLTVGAPDGQPMLVNDLSTGRFDVRVKVGASYTTSRVEAREHMAEALQGNPDLWNVIGDLVFENSDYPGAQQIAERMKRAIPPQLLGEEAEQKPDPIAQMAARLEMEQKVADIEKTEAETEKIEAQTHTEVAETHKRVEEAAAL